MLGIDRQNLRAVVGRSTHHHAAGADQRFLVGERERAAGPERRHGRAQTRRAHDRRHRPVSTHCRGLNHRLLASSRLDAAIAQSIAQRIQPCLIGNDRAARTHATRHCGKSSRVLGRSYSQDFESVRVALDQIEGRSSDRTGGSQYGD